jgi:hypothetical protein
MKMRAVRNFPMAKKHISFCLSLKDIRKVVADTILLDENNLISLTTYGKIILWERNFSCDSDRKIK